MRIMTYKMLFCRFCLMNSARRDLHNKRLESCSVDYKSVKIHQVSNYAKYKHGECMKMKYTRKRYVIKCWEHQYAQVCFDYEYMKGIYVIIVNYVNKFWGIYYKRLTIIMNL